MPRHPPANRHPRRATGDDPAGQYLSRATERRTHGLIGYRCAAERFGAEAHQVQGVEKVHQGCADAEPLLLGRDIWHVVTNPGHQRGQSRAIESPRPGPLDLFDALATLRRTQGEQHGQRRPLGVTNDDEAKWPQAAVVRCAERQLRSALPLLGRWRRGRQELGAHRVSNRQHVERF